MSAILLPTGQQPEETQQSLQQLSVESGVPAGMSVLFSREGIKEIFDWAKRAVAILSTQVHTTMRVDDTIHPFLPADSFPELKARLEMDLAFAHGIIGTESNERIVCDKESERLFAQSRETLESPMVAERKTRNLARLSLLRGETEYRRLVHDAIAYRGNEAKRSSNWERSPRMFNGFENATELAHGEDDLIEGLGHFGAAKAYMLFGGNDNRTRAVFEISELKRKMPEMERIAGKNSPSIGWLKSAVERLLSHLKMTVKPQVPTTSPEILRIGQQVFKNSFRM